MKNNNCSDILFKGVFVRFLFISIPLILLFTSIVWKNLHGEIEIKKAVLLSRASLKVGIAEKTIVDHFLPVVLDIRYLSRESALVHSIQEKKLKHIERHYFHLSVSKQLYDQIRFIDASGMEVIRVDLNNGSPYIVPKDELQSKLHRYYFKKTMLMKKGDIYISPLDLNIENKEIEIPFNPVIRFGSPVYGMNDTFLGVVIINYTAGELLDDLKELSSFSAGDFMLTDSHGNWFIDTDSKNLWGSMLPERKELTFPNKFPDAWQKIIRKESGQFSIKSGIFTFETVYPQINHNESNSEINQTPKQIKKEGFWKLIYHYPPSDFEPDYKAIMPIFAGITFIILIGSWGVASAQVKNKTAEDLLVHSAKLASIGQLAGGVAHEIRTCLGGMMNYASRIEAEIKNRKTELVKMQSLQKDLSDSTNIKKGYDKTILDISEKIISSCINISRHENKIFKNTEGIKEMADRGSKITNDLLAFSKKRLPNINPAQIKKVIESAVDVTALELKKANIKIIREYAPNLPEVPMDPDQISQVVMNIIINARNAIDKKGTIVVKSDLDNDKKFLRVKVSDTGKGIPKDNMDMIFDPFFTTYENGTGLGLSISYGIVQNHNGKIKVESSIGKGTTFTVLLPLC